SRRAGAKLKAQSSKLKRMANGKAPGRAARIEIGAWRLELLLSFELGLLSFSSAFAAVPTLDHLYPVAVQAGATNSVTAIGKFDPWPVKVWVDAPGVVFRPETNSGKFKVEVAADAPVGPRLIRAFDERGASVLRFLVVTREPQLVEQEPNDDFARP